ncbi:MAG: TldD/PmbA family protein [Parvularculaceae bacterium]|nr:TldD/PmbA family protein [Parvularculaceae bacterium]
MNDSDAQIILDHLIASARRAGADAADAVIYRSVSSGVTWRLGKLEDVERSEGRDLGLRILTGKRQASVSTTDFSKPALAELVERCAAMAKTAPEDPYCGLAPVDRLAKPPFPDLEAGDFAEPDTSMLKQRAAACEEAALAVTGVVNSDSAGASYGEGAKWFATSSGFFGVSRGSHHSLSVTVIAEDANGMERDYDWDSKRYVADLREPEAIGARAGARAVERLSPRRIKSQTAPVIYDRRLSGSLLSTLAGAANGAAIARGVSFLKDKKGAAVFPRGVNVIDDPHMKRGHGSRPFDGEGVAAGVIKLIDDGVLADWIMNSSQARQLKLATNGRATRGVGGPPGSGPTNLYLENGRVSRAALMAQAGKGLLVTDMFGPQVNSNTGDYSVGCAGFWFENGAIAHAVSEITVAGNILDMFKSLVPADDLEFTGAVNAPSLLVGEMTIAGD